MGHFQKCITQ